MENLVNKEFWKGKKVFITGHTGFKGTWLSIWLKKLGAEVYGYALAPKHPSMFNAVRMDTMLENKLNGSCIADIRNQSKFGDYIWGIKPEIVFHLAAQPLVRESYCDPIKTFETNIMGTMNLLEICRGISSIKAIVNVTTDKVYKNKLLNIASPGYEEHDELGAQDPYAGSKVCSEIITEVYKQSFFKNIGVATARSGNVIGGGDWGHDRLIPDCIRAFLDEAYEKTVTIRNPDFVRPWLYVLDTLRGYLILAQHLYISPFKCVKNNSFNFGPDTYYTVKQLIEVLISIWGDDVKYKIIEEENKELHEDAILKLDYNKSNLILNWEPKLGIVKSLEMTVEWYKQIFVYGNQNMYDFTVKQIEEYEGM